MSIIAGKKGPSNYILMQNLEEPLRMRLITSKGFFANFDRKTIAGVNEFGVAVVSLHVETQLRAEKDMCEFLNDHFPDAKSAEELIQKLRTFPKDGHNFIVADKDDLFVTETSPKSMEVKRVGTAVRSDHHILLEDDDKKIQPRADVRMKRALILIEKVKDIESAKNLLSDHNFGKNSNSICSHGSLSTKHSFILTPEFALYTDGHPCMGRWKRFDL
jgi:hypothetical protein